MFVYAIRAEGSDKVKIGRATDVASRLSTLQTGSPTRLWVYAARECRDAMQREQRAHRALAAYRASGEWFRWTPEVRAYVREQFFVAPVKHAAFEAEMERMGESLSAANSKIKDLKKEIDAKDRRIAELRDETSTGALLVPLAETLRSLRLVLDVDPGQIREELRISGYSAEQVDLMWRRWARGLAEHIDARAQLFENEFSLATSTAKGFHLTWKTLAESRALGLGSFDRPEVAKAA